MVLKIGSGAAQSYSAPQTSATVPSPVQQAAPQASLPQSAAPSGGTQASDPQGQSGSDSSQASAATKVVVEPGADKMTLVFKVLDASTGAILTEIPQESIQQAAKSLSYSAGQFLNQTA